MTRRLLLAPAVIGAVATAEIIRRAAWLAWPLAHGAYEWWLALHREPAYAEDDYTA